MTVRPAESADPAQWLLQSDVDWWDLVRYGPPGFDVYVRIAFADGAYRAREEPSLRAALASALPGAVRQVPYGEAAPLHRE